MDNQYHDKLNQYIHSIQNIMYTFEITKCCEYSTFITMYKNETIVDLYTRIINHFEGIEIKELYFYDSNGEKIHIFPSKITISEFVRTNIVCNPQKLIPIYKLPNPLVYRLYFNDGNCNGNCNVNCNGI